MQLRAGYGPVNVLQDIELTVDDAEIVVVLGANGAGKTTTIRAISGTIHALRERHVRRAGRSSRRPPRPSSGRASPRCPRDAGTFPELNVAGQPAHRRLHPARRRCDRRHRPLVPDLPAARRAARPARREPVGWRAADAGHRPGPHESTEVAPLRRAQPGPGADHRSGDVPDHRFAEQAGGHRRAAGRAERQPGDGDRPPGVPLGDRQDRGLRRRQTIAADDSIRKAYLGY